MIFKALNKKDITITSDIIVCLPDDPRATMALFGMPTGQAKPIVIDDLSLVQETGIHHTLVSLARYLFDKGEFGTYCYEDKPNKRTYILVSDGKQTIKVWLYDKYSVQGDITIGTAIMTIAR